MPDCAAGVDARCCDNYKRDVCRRKIVDAIQRLVFKKLPQVPKSNKWTKLGPCLDWFLVAMAPHSMFVYIYRHAFDKMSIKFASTVEDAEKDQAKEGMESALMQEINWHAVQGKRMKNGKEFMENDEKQFLIVALALVVEPLRWLTKWLMIKSRLVKKPGSVPALCSWVFGPTSPIVIVRQYYSLMLSGNAPRLRLL